MQTKKLHLAKWLAVPAFLGLATFASAQSSPTQKPAQDSDDVNRGQVERFDQFLDNHREIGEQLRKDPSLVNDRQFVKNHPALQTYLRDHPDQAKALKNDPTSFMKAEGGYEREESRARRGDLNSFDGFLDSHRQIDQQLRRDPSLVNNPQYLKDHPELQTYLRQHPEVRDQINKNPDAFMRAENRYEPQENSHDLDRGVDRDRRELASFDQFMDSHREISEQLNRNPSLADNQQFLKDHPALQSYLQNHPAVRQQLQRDPSAFMQQEARYDRREDDTNRGGTADRDRGTIPDQDRNANSDRNRDTADRDRGNGDDRNGNNGVDRDRNKDRDRNNDMDRDRDAHRHFGEFLANHGDIAQQLSHDPSSVKRDDYLRDHPELKDYLSQHPDVRQPLMADPQTFVTKSTQLNNGQPVKSPTTAPTSSPTSTPKPNKQ